MRWLPIRSGGMSWQVGKDGRVAPEHARSGTSRDRAAIVELLARPVIRHPQSQAAVKAIQAGDQAALDLLLDAMALKG